MAEIKPSWRIAQQISKRHTWISFLVSMPLFLITILVAIISLKLLGYQHSGLVLHQFFLAHQKIIVSIVLFIHLVPVNYYAIMKVFSSPFSKFEIKIISK